MKSLSKLGKQLGDSSRALGDKIRRTPVKQPKREESQPQAVDSRILTPGESEEERAAILGSLPAEYFDENFDALDFELRKLPLNFEAGSLDSVVEEHTTVLEVVSEKLSHHIIQNYDKFVDGVNEVIHVEEDLQAAHVTTKTSRERLALALREVGNSMRIARDTRRKQALTTLLEVLLRLQQAANLQRALKEAQEDGEYAEAFWLCAQCIKSMDELGDDLHVAAQLTVSINKMYEDTTQRLEAALAAVCNDFRPDHYSKVLEGYMFLGNVDQLGSEVKTAFVNTINTAVQKVVRGVLLTRTGFEEKAAVASNLQDLVRYLPSDLFRTCLARVLMVLFDILVSHFHMVRWHEASLERHQIELDALSRAKQQLHDRVGDANGAIFDTARRESPRKEAGGGQAGIGDASSSGRGVAGGQAHGGDLIDLANGTADSELHPPQHQQQQQQQQGQPVGAAAMRSSAAGGSLSSSRHGSGAALLHDSDSDSPVTVTGRAMMQLHRGTASELEEVEAKESDEAEWGSVLRAVHAGLIGGRKLIWDEAARRIGVLLSIPAAFEGEHFLQVMDWTQRVLAIGESFSGVECAGLRTLLQRQSGNFFQAYHTSNVEALNSMLDKELWKRLPVAPPGLAETLVRRQGSEDALHSFADFEQHVNCGNPWRRQQGSPRKRPKRPSRLGFAGASNMEDGKTAHQLDVDEYGIPRTVSSGGSSGPGSSRGSTEQSEHDSTPGAAESDEVFGDFIDEETQSVRTADGEAVAGGSSGSAIVTNSSWRMMKWMRDYFQLMRTLCTATPTIFAGLTELYDLYLLHIYITFGEVPLPDLLALAQQAQQGPMAAAGAAGTGGALSAAAADSALTPRLRSTLLRIASDSIGKYRGLLVGHQAGSKVARALTPREPGSPSISAYSMDTFKDKLSLKETAGTYFSRKMGTGGPAAAAAAAGGGVGALGVPAAAGSGAAHPALGPPEVAMVANSGNLYGLQERCLAVESLLLVARELARARSELSGLLPPSEAHALDLFYSRAVGSAEDLRDHVLRAGARLLLPIRWLPDRVAATTYSLAEPPVSHQPWVDELERSLEHFRDRLATASLPAEALAQLWCHAAAYVAEAALEGIVRVKKCTLEGRAAMSVDLQGVARALSMLSPRGAPAPNLRLVDSYIKAFYIPVEELARWAQIHPEYRPDQVLALTACIAESSGLKRKDKQALLARVEADLRSFS